MRLWKKYLFIANNTPPPNLPPQGGGKRGKGGEMQKVSLNYD